MKMIVVFEKKERLRFIGHLDLMRAMQRALRRSGLPLRYSQGFNPHILLTFAAPLSNGMPGKREIMEVPIETPVAENEFAAALSQALPPDLVVVSVRAVDDAHPAAMSLLAAASYEAVPDEIPENINGLIGAYLAQPAINTVKKTKSGEKECDIKPLIYHFDYSDGKLRMTLALSADATCKPDLLLNTFYDFAGIPRPRIIVTRLALYGGTDTLVPLETL